MKKKKGEYAAKTKKEMEQKQINFNFSIDCDTDIKTNVIMPIPKEPVDKVDNNQIKWIDHLSEIVPPQGNINIKVKIIWDKNPAKEMFGKQIKTVVVCDVNAIKGDGSKTSFLDLYNEDATKYKFGDKLKIINGYAKSYGNAGQIIINNVNKIERIE